MIMFNLAEIMKERNISINKLSTETKINRASLTSIANNDSKMIQLSTIETLLNYLKIPLNEFVYDDSNAVKLNFEFNRIDYLTYICKIDYSYNYKHSSETGKLRIERLSNNDIKLSFSELDYLQSQWAGSVGYGYKKNENLSYEVKDIFGTTSLEKQQHVGTLIFNKIMSNLPDTPNADDIGGYDDDDKEEYKDAFFEDDEYDLNEILENIDLIKNAYFVDDIFSGRLSGIYYSNFYKKQMEHVPSLDLYFSGNGDESDIKVFESDSSVLVNVKVN